MPIKFVIWQGNGFNLDFTVAQAISVLDELNLRYCEAGAGVEFYLIDIPQIKTNAQFADGISANETTNLFSTEHSNNRITVHFVGGNSSALGFAPLPGQQFNKSIWIRDFGDLIEPNNTTIKIQQIGGTLAHEVGHTFGLLHTHHPGRQIRTVFGVPLASFEDNGAIGDSFTCYQEVVSRGSKNWREHGCLDGTHGVIKCTINGDFLCDTEADPNLSKLVFNDSRTESLSTTTPSGSPVKIPPCGYEYNASLGDDYNYDNDGGLWLPNGRNMMAEGNRICRSFFSNGQIAIIWRYFNTNNFNLEISGPSYIGCSNPEIFAFPMIPNATYVWSVGNNVILVSGQGTNRISIQGLPNRNLASSSVNVRVTSPYLNMNVTYFFMTGKPTISGIGGNTSVFMNSINGYTLLANRATSYSWSVNNAEGWSIVGPSIYSIVNIQAGVNNNIITGSAINDCGSTSANLNVVISKGSNCEQPHLQVVENPIRGNLKLSTSVLEPCLGLLNTNRKYKYKISMYNMQERKVLDTETELAAEEELNLNINGFQKGIYVLRIHGEKSNEVMRVVVE